MNEPQKKKSWTDDLPFPKRWLGYIALKVIALVVLVFVALRWKGLV